MENRQVVFVKRPAGAVTPDCYELRDGAVPETGDGDVLVRNIYLSCDPYMRGQMDSDGGNKVAFPLEEVIPARVVGQVEKSRNADFKEGEFVWSFLGWELFTLAPGGEGLRKIDPSLGPISHAISVLGMPGLTAYVGMIDIGRPESDETVFVSAASGAVGQVAGQLAKLRGARVVGSAGSDAKVDHIVKTLGFDQGFNYKTVSSIGAALDETCPNGIDVYFDNVGGETLDEVLARINTHARLPICGQISQYDRIETGNTESIRNVSSILRAHATMRGFSVRDNMDQFDDYVTRMAALMKAGDVVYAEDIVDGIENAPAAFIDMMKGENLGKRLVRVGEDPTL